MVHIVKQNEIAATNREIVSTADDIKTLTAFIGDNQLGFKCEISAPENPEQNRFSIKEKEDGYYFTGISRTDEKEKSYFIEPLQGENERLIKKLIKHPEHMEYVLASYDPEFNEEKVYEPYIIYNPGVPLVYDLMYHVFFKKLDIQDREDLMNSIRINARVEKMLR